MNEITNDRAIVVDGLDLADYRDMGHAISTCMRTLGKLAERAATEDRRMFYTRACDSLDAILGGLADVFGEACAWRADVWNGELYPYPRFRVRGAEIIMEPPSEPDVDDQPDVDDREAEAAKLTTYVFGTMPDGESEVDVLRADATRALFAEECRDRGLELG